ncbi:DnaJ domain-containing protein [Colletotrichum musicola]|uniref:DnaJ domain-containing protein n=1 Tax=Colletotrichum musicola TaxID=2175873 RepID=A0A8H6JL27_9PEZI|nr:DnaJ domain-containing protein [Colletotrichum musicola]
MGAQQSSGRGQGDDSTSQPVKTCYYELLAIERDATDDEIKKAYRKRALELHPDRNLADTENATRRFAEVQAAYEVLSDPQERSWYDSHREAILRGADVDETDGRSPEYNNVKLTSTEDIFSLIRRFNATVPFTDEPTGFFGIAKATFDHLADEEIAAGDYAPEDAPDYPSFGFSADTYEDVARPFYSAWAGFSTRKSFSWRDKYRLSDAPDRRVRRLMEKENKKLRDEAARDFNDAVRFLITFVRKRDPRYLPNTQTDAERQESLRTAAAAQAARSRAANIQKLSEAVVPDWAQSRDDGDAGDHFSEIEEDSEVEEIECVVCNKTFKSEKSFEAHERSKKHLKAVQQLRRQMRNEDVDLSLHESIPASEKATTVEAVDEVYEDRTKETRDEVNDDTCPAAPATDSKHPEAPDSNHSFSNPSDDEYASRTDIEKRLFAGDRPLGETIPGDTSDVDVGRASISVDMLSLNDGEDCRPQPKKVGRAKVKREKKAARQAAEETGTVSIEPDSHTTAIPIINVSAKHECAVCRASFPSKTKLFSHIRALNHAAPIGKPSGSNKKR